MRQKMLGDNHPDTVTSMGMLVTRYYCQSAALRKLKSCTPDFWIRRKKQLGIKHPDVLATMGNMASTYLHQGHLKYCKQLHLQVLEVSKAHIVKEHPNTRISVDYLAYVCTLLGHLDQARRLREEVSSCRKKALGRGGGGQSTRWSMEQMAGIYGAQKSWKEAEALQVQVAEIRENLFGSGDWSTLTSMSYLAVLYYQQGWCQRSNTARSENDGDLEESARGEKNPQSLISISSLATMFKAIGYLHEARAFEQQALDIRRERLGEQHLEIIKSL